MPQNSSQVVLTALRLGDVIQHKPTGQGYIVVDTFPAVIAVRTITVSNPDEWQLICKSQMVQRTPEEQAEYERARSVPGQ